MPSPRYIERAVSNTIQTMIYTIEHRHLPPRLGEDLPPIARILARYVDYYPLHSTHNGRILLVMRPALEYNYPSGDLPGSEPGRVRLLLAHLNIRRILHGPLARIVYCILVVWPCSPHAASDPLFRRPIQDAMLTITLKHARAMPVVLVGAAGHPGVRSPTDSLAKYRFPHTPKGVGKPKRSMGIRA